MSGELVGQVIVHSAELIVLDPAIRAAVGFARDKVDELLQNQRLENIRRIVERAAKMLSGKKAEPPPLSVSVPLLEAARDESREELLEIWASLLATASDPSRSALYRREFVDIARKLEPIDALVLPLLDTQTSMQPTRLVCVSQRLQISEDQVLLAFRNVERLELVEATNPSVNWQVYPFTSALGRQFLMAAQKR